MKSIFDINDRPVDEKVRTSLRSLAVMAAVAGVVMAINALLSVVSMIMLYTGGGEYRPSREGFGGTELPTPQAPMSMLILQSTITLVLWGALTYFLIGFARKTKSGLDTNNQSLITTGLGNLASYFKIIGILLCFFVGLMLLGLLTAL